MHRRVDLLPVGVVTLAERYGGRFVDHELFEAMVGDVLALLAPFEAEHRLRERMADKRAAPARHLGHRHDGCGRAPWACLATTAGRWTGAGCKWSTHAR